jgi:N-acyl-D-amino-acid deacylase
MLDLLIRDGFAVDGTGGPAYPADIGIREDRIVEIGRVSQPARRVIDATGLVVAPGFVDMHAHSDLQLLLNPAHEAKVHQGVTLELIGQDGLSYSPVSDASLAELRVQLAGWNDDSDELEWDWRTVAEYLARLDRGVAVNAAYLVPHGTVRLTVMGADDRPATAAELASMKRLVAAGIADGAVGLSAGLTYTPGMYGSDDELVELCSVMRGTTGFYCPHHRDYGAGAIDAYRDCIEIARKAGVRLHIPHTSLPFEVNRGRAPELLAHIEAALAEGVDITLDLYPYNAGSTALYAFMPGWARAGGTAATLDRLRDATLRERLREEFEVTGSDGFFGVPIDWTTIVVSDVGTVANGRFVGKTIADCAKTTGKRPIDFLCELLAAEELKVGAINHVGNEDNLRTILAHPVATVGSDGILVGNRPHPRGWGTFARILAVYVRELGLLTLEEAVRKMTSLPARRLGFPDRGLLRPGFAADVVCFDAGSVLDAATYEEPRKTAEGFPFVAVNGVLVVDEGRRTDALPGRALRRPSTVT